MTHLKRSLGLLLILSSCARAPAAPDQFTPEEHRQISWRVAGYPSKNHKVLDPLAGAWNVEITAWTAPGKAPDVFAGKANRRWILDGRFLEETFDGELWKELLQAQGLLGYDRTAKEYVATWVDTFSTAIRLQRGSFDPAKRELVLRGTYVDPADGSEHRSESITKILGPDLHVVEAWEIDPDGSRRKTTEFTFSRR